MSITPSIAPSIAGEFDEPGKLGLYRAIHSRRDVRSHFVGGEIPEQTLARVLNAAHHAPSVGFMQPWNFILIRDPSVRMEIRDAFLRANAEAVALFPEEKREKYRGLKLEGILESSINLCVTCDRKRFGPVVLGKTCQENMDLFSTVCAVQNLWLAARTEGLGVGWVSIIRPEELTRVLRLPDGVVPVAYLCMGYVSSFPEKPDLESAGWLPRLPLEDLVFCDRWGEDCKQGWESLHETIAADRKKIDLSRI